MLAGSVDEMEVARRAVLSVCGHAGVRDRFAGCGEPACPFIGGGGLVAGVEEEVTADGALAALLLERAQGALVQRWPFPAAPFGPVLGKSGVIW